MITTVTARRFDSAAVCTELAAGGGYSGALPIRPHPITLWPADSEIEGWTL